MRDGLTTALSCVALSSALLFGGCGSQGGVTSNNNGMTGTSADTDRPATPNAELLWSASVPNGGGSLASAQLDGDVLVFQSSDREVSAWTKDGLQPRWTFRQIDGDALYAPSVGPSAVGVVTRDRLWAIDVVTGARLSSGEITFTPAAAPALSASTCYFPALSDNRVYAVDLASGDTGWRRRLGAAIAASPVVAGPVGKPILVVATEDGGLVAFPAVSYDSQAPDALWQRFVPGDITSELSMSIDRDLVFVSSTDKVLYALDAATGEQRWAFYSKKPLQGTAVHMRAKNGDSLVFQHADGMLHALDAATGKERWRIEGATRPVCEWGGAFLLLGPGNTLRRVSAETGETIGAGTANGAFVLTDPVGGHLMQADGNWQLEVSRYRPW